MLSFEAVGDLLDQIAEAFPQVFYEKLNGGISLLPNAKTDPAFPSGEVYVMGEYCNDQMGRYIHLYYGSFAALYSDLPDTALEEELRITLAHEFTHHMEGLAGERGLEVKDKQFAAEYYAEREGKADA